MAYDRDDKGRWICTACGRIRGSHDAGCPAAAVEAELMRRAWGRFPWLDRGERDG